MRRYKESKRYYSDEEKEMGMIHPHMFKFS
jgi:hypothetical protein